MDIMQNSEREKTDRAKKMMLWFGIVSLLMAFAGWTSAYIVSSTRKDWSADFSLPSAFLYSTVVIIISSVTYILAHKALKKGNSHRCTSFLLTTLLLGIGFIFLQFHGFSQLVAQGYYFTGPTSNITTSYIFLIAVVHIVHVIAGLISLSVVLFNHLHHKYSPDHTLGMELGATFWHFLDLLWVYLILFFFFFR